MTKLQVTEINCKEQSINLNHQIQKQVQGGINMELFNLLEQNKEGLMALYGNLSPSAFMLNIVIDRGLNNQISQSPS